MPHSVLLRARRCPAHALALDGESGARHAADRAKAGADERMWREIGQSVDRLDVLARGVGERIERPTVVEALDTLEPVRPLEELLPLWLPIQAIYKFDGRRIAAANS